MADRFKFAEVRQEVIEMLKKDLLGPSSENEILNQNPRFEYIVGMLAPQTSENDSNEQEVDGDASFEGDADYTVGEDDDNEPVFTNRFKTPSSIGISFYLESSTKSFNVDVTWGDYTKASDKTTNKEGKKVDVSTYTRHPQKETVVIDLQEFSKNKEYPLVCDSNVILYISKISLKQGYTLVTAYVINKRKNPESDIAGMMFQVNLCAYSQEKMDIFVAEHICRKILAVDEFYADAAREAVHFGEEFFGNAVFARIGDAGVNDLLRTTETVVGIDHLLAREDFVAVGTKRFNDEGGGAEFAPTFFRHGVEVTANFDELIVVSASRGHFVSVS